MARFYYFPLPLLLTTPFVSCYFQILNPSFLPRIIVCVLCGNGIQEVDGRKWYVWLGQSATQGQTTTSRGYQPRPESELVA